MKTSSLLLMLLFFSCGKETSLTPNLQSCTLADSGWFVQKEIHDIEGTIVLDTSNKYLISLEDRKLTGWEYLGPCNLPDNHKTPNSKVKISGKIYSHRHLDYPYPPFELTSIRFSN
jgi:hypothetical protein